MKKCVIVGAGSFFGIENMMENALIIAADGGYERLTELGIYPNAVIGDFDSCKSIPQHENLMRFKAEKDETDTELALIYGFNQGCREFHVYGGTGGRFSHTVANIQNLANYAQKGCVGFLYGENEVTVVAAAREVSFSQEARGYVSLFALSDNITGVTEQGLKYSLENAHLQNAHPLGVSNQFTGSHAKISVSSGIFAIITEVKNLPYISIT